METANNYSAHPFDFTKISDELAVRASEEVRKHVPEFGYLLAGVWNESLTAEEAAQSMSRDNYQNLFLSLSEGQIIQIENSDFFFRMTRFRPCVIIGLASIDRYIQITAYILKFNGNKPLYYVYPSSKRNDSTNPHNKIFVKKAKISLARRAKRRHLRDLLEITQRRLYLLERQKAVYGIFAPPQIDIEIEYLRTEVDNRSLQIEQELNQEYSDWYVVKNSLREVCGMGYKS